MNAPNQRDEAIFDAAIDLQAEERAAYLTQACGDDVSLHKRIESLIAGHEQSTGVLEDSAALTLRKNITASQLPAEKSGDHIGRYRLLQQIGEGGCGVVYMAEQEEPLRRRVALKVIKLGMDTRQVIARFEAERQAIALMEHANIAKVLDAGATDTGRPFFVMELVRGIKITDYCDANNLATEERLKLLMQVCQAIQHAHQKGIIHRDIKPSNILVTLHDGVPVPKVIDFGIAKATTNQRLTDKTLFTAFEQFIGTPAYMSPEQAEMSGLDIDTRSDIYALGVLLYELLTSTTPFDAKSLASAGLDEMRRTIREQDPAPPSTRLSTMLAGDIAEVASHRQAVPARFVSSIRGDLDWIVMKAIEKDRTRRYETANGLAMDIQRFLNHEPVEARPSSNLYRIQKMVRRNKLACAAIVAVAVALLFGFVGVIWQWRRAETFADGEAKLRLLTEEQVVNASLHRYAGDVNLASQAITRGDFGLARRTLAALRPIVGETDLRGFEWRYLWKLCQGDQLATLTGHEWIVTCVAFSPNGKLMASGSQDRTVKVWDVEKLELIATLSAATGSVCSVAFSPDGAQLVTSGRGGTRLWDTDTWQLSGQFPGQIAVLTRTGSVLAVSDASPFYRRDAAGQISLWDFRSGEKLRTLSKPGNALAFSPDGRRLATSGKLSGIDLWDVASGSLLRTLPISNPVWSLAFSPDGNQLVATIKLKDPMVWDLIGVQPPRTLKGHSLMVWSANYSPDGTTIVTTGSDQTVRLWDAATLQLKSILRGHDHEVWCAAFSPDSQRIVTGGKDRNVMMWSSELRMLRDTVPNHASMKPFFSADSTRLATVTSPGSNTSTVLWNVQDRTMASTIPGWRAIGFSPDGRQLSRWSPNVKALESLIVGATNMMRVPLGGVDARSRNPQAYGFSSDWKWFFAVDGEGRAGVWEAGSGKLRAKFQGPPPPINRGTLSPNGRYLALGAENENVVRLFDCDTLSKMQLHGHRDAVRGLAFSPDGATLASGSLDGTIRLWNTSNGNHLVTLPGHVEESSDVTFSPDGRTLASVNLNHSIKLWHLATQREMVSLDVPDAGEVLQFSPDGRTLSVTTDKNFIRLFDAPPLEELDQPVTTR